MRYDPRELAKVARGKYPQPYCPSNTNPYISESSTPDSGVRSPNVHLRHRGLQQPPQGPAWPRGNYLLDLKPFLCAGRMITTVAGLGRGSQTYTRGATSVLWTLSYWVTSSGGHTISL